MLSKDFILGGRAVCTVVSPKGPRYTYKIKRRVFPDQSARTFAYLLTGPDNTRDFTYMGMVDERDLRVFPTKKSKYTPASTPLRVLNWALQHVKAAHPFPAGYELHHEGRCGCCGRALTVPESIERGIGPECFSRLGG
jgi:hypothetical protein